MSEPEIAPVEEVAEVRDETIEEKAVGEEPAAWQPVENADEEETVPVNEAPAEDPLAWAPEAPVSEEPVEPAVEAVVEPIEIAPESAEAEAAWDAPQEQEPQQPPAVQEQLEPEQEAEEPAPPVWEVPAAEPEAREEEVPSGEPEYALHHEPAEEAWQPETEEVEEPAPVSQEIASEDVLAVFEVNEDVSVTEEDMDEEADELPLDLSISEEPQDEAVATASADVVEPEAATTSSTEMDWGNRGEEEVAEAPAMSAEDMASAALSDEAPAFELPELDPTPSATMQETAVEDIEVEEVEAEAVADVTPEPDPAPMAVEPPAAAAPPEAPARSARFSGSEYLLGDDPAPTADPSAALPESARALKIQFFAPQQPAANRPASGLVTMTLPGMLPTGSGPSIHSSKASRAAEQQAAPTPPVKPQFQVVNPAPTKTITITPQQYAEPSAADGLTVDPHPVPAGPPPQLIIPPGPGSAPRRFSRRYRRARR